MRLLRHSIGMILASLLILWTGLTPVTAHAGTSPSYQLSGIEDDADNFDSDNPISGSTESMTVQNLTLTSTSYQLSGGLEPEDSTTDSEATDQTSGSSGGSGAGGGGSRGDRAGTVLGTGTTESSAPAAENTPSSAPAHSRPARTPTSVTHESPGSTAYDSATDVFAPSIPSLQAEHMTVRGGASRSPSDTTGTLSFFGAADAVQIAPETTPHAAAPDPMGVSVPLLLFSAVLTIVNAAMYFVGSATRTRRAKAVRRRVMTLTILAVIAALMAFIIPLAAHADNITIPVMKNYNGSLLNSNGSAVTTPITLRFSYWKSANYLPSDTTSSGAINTGAPNYLGWFETHSTTPNSRGSFTVKIGSVTPLLSFKTLSVTIMQGYYMQVEVKPAGSPNSAYEILDIDSLDDTVDRAQITPVSFARNADLFDQHDTGTGSSDIPYLDNAGRLPVSTMAGGTNPDAFTIDADNSAATAITLRFGAALGKTLSYDLANNLFLFNAPLKVQGNLTVTGLINGVDIGNLTSITDALKATSGAGLNVNVHGGSYRLNGVVTNYSGGTIGMSPNATNFVFFGSGGLVKNLTGFPSDDAYIAIAEVVTNGGAVVVIRDRRITSNDDRERTVTATFTPTYDGASYQGDGTENVGQLSVSHDNASLGNFYLWTSTKSTLQDYDLLLRVPVAGDFLRWQSNSTTNPLSFEYRTTSVNAAENELGIQVFDTNGVPVTLSGSTTHLTGATWRTAQVEFTGSPTWAAGGNMLVKITFAAKDGKQAQLGALTLRSRNMLGR